MLYTFFNKHKTIFWITLLISSALLLWTAGGLSFNSDITHFFPEKGPAGALSQIFENLKAKDRIFILLSTSPEQDAAPNILIEKADQIAQRLDEQFSGSLIRKLTTGIDSDLSSEQLKLFYENLPIYLNQSDYQRLETLLTPEKITQLIQSGRERLSTPSSFIYKDIFRNDPLGMLLPTLKELNQFSSVLQYQLYDDYFFSPDLRTLYIFIDPVYGINRNEQNLPLVKTLELLSAEYSTPELSMRYCGAPVSSVQNAQQIKKDLHLTLSISTALILLLTLFLYRSLLPLILICLPAIWGSLFAAASIRLFTSQVSVIAIAASSSILGVAVSYAIHVLFHASSSHSPSELIRELTLPLTIGSFTTIGAFIGLTFTTSELLADFGLFSALALTGAILFSLVFLPHFIPKQFFNSTNTPTALKLPRWFQKLSDTPFEQNIPLLLVLFLLLTLGFINYHKVTFDPDLYSLNYQTPEIHQAEKELHSLFTHGISPQFLVNPANNLAEALPGCWQTAEYLAKLQSEGKIENYISPAFLLPPLKIQQSRLNQWKTFWNSERKEKLTELLNTAATKNGFKSDVFAPFFHILETDFAPLIPSAEEIANSPLLSEWIDISESQNEKIQLLTQIYLTPEQKKEVYPQLALIPGLGILDRSYFTKWMLLDIKNNFNLILFISGSIVFLALLISYGRLELTLMAFLPMCLSFIIILGFMALLDIRFNIVNIILCTFIYGIGDDFSIFVMDGLLNEYKTGKKTLSSHKTAIFFSGLITLIGIGALLFAKHPAIHSLALISILGIFSVILCSTTLQPFLFRILISSQTSRGGLPYTFLNLIRSGTIFGTFFFGSLLLHPCILLLSLLPVSRQRHELLCRSLIHIAMKSCMAIIRLFGVKIIIEKQAETFRKPSIIIANHQSFFDIILLLSLHKNLIILTNNWVWKSPIFGFLIRRAGYFNISEGRNKLIPLIREKLSQGCSVLIFPEGTRSEDLQIHRFHKGAFLLAQTLQTELQPVLLYGTGMLCPKKQPFLIRTGYCVVKFLAPIPPNKFDPDTSLEKFCGRQTKLIRELFQKEYQLLQEHSDSPINPYFYRAYILSQVYKSPILEWYMRIKLKIEHSYALFDSIIPKKAKIIDIGCGYGPMTYLLGLYSKDRQLLGIDYDEEKIAQAKHNLFRRPEIRFCTAHALDIDYPQADIFLISDMLHYLKKEDQYQLLQRCIQKLNPQGKIIIRDGDSGRKSSHWLTLLTEKLSTQIFRFNKTQQPLSFISKEELTHFARLHQMDISTIENDQYTSNTLYILTQNNEKR